MHRYFAYGSNVHQEHFRIFLTSHGVDPDGIKVVRRAVLPGYRLRTNYLTAGRGAAANVELASGCRVEGLVMQVSEAIRDALRIKEGWPFRYEEIPVRVRLRNGWTVHAFTYIVTERMRSVVDLPVSLRYRQLIIEGARTMRFSRVYQQQLDALLKTA